jgi:spermidine/putrescine transport system permease protein
VYGKAYKAAVAIPPLVWVTAFLLIPYLFLFCNSFWHVTGQTVVHEWTLENYRELFRNPMYGSVLGRSARIAGTVTVLSVLMGFPLAYYISFHCSRRKELLYQLVIIPLWVSYLVRAYAWKTILGSDGVLNSLLQFLHLSREPLGFLLYSPLAVLITLTHIYVAFAFLPIYASLEQIPRNLIEAARDLGASGPRTFWTVIFPQSLPGLIAGATFAFVLSLGDFLSPLLVGGPSGIMISNVVVSLFGAAFNWPLGAAVSLTLLLLVLALLWVTERAERRLTFH